MPTSVNDSGGGGDSPKRSSSGRLTMTNNDRSDTMKVSNTTNVDEDSCASSTMPSVSNVLMEDFGTTALTSTPSKSSAAPITPPNNESLPSQLSPSAAKEKRPSTPSRSRSNSGTNNTSNNNNTPSSAIPSFTSDSPYLQSYIDREMRNLHVLTETLRDISARARTFGKCGALMAEATRRLSSACRLNPPNGSSSGGNNTRSSESGGEETDQDEQLRVMTERQESIGDEMTSVLSVLGEILDEVADAQVSMCQSLEASLSLSLEAFAGVELNEATRLRSEADVMSENAESSFSKYMHGRHTERANMAGGIGGGGGGMEGISSTGSGSMAMDAMDQQNFVTSWNKLSDHVGSQFKNWNRAASNESASSGEGTSEAQQTLGKEGAGRRLKNLRDRMNNRGNLLFFIFCLGKSINVVPSKK